MINNYNKCSLIANRDGMAWEFASKVCEYIKKREDADLSRKKSAFIDNIVNTNPEIKDHPLLINLTGSIFDNFRNQDGNSVELNELKIRKFPDGEHVPIVTSNIRGSNCYFIHDSNLNPDTWLSQLVTTRDSLRSSSANRITFVLPYFKFNRQDRKDRSRTSVNTRVIAEATDIHNGKILTLDVHSKATEALYRYATFDGLLSYTTVVEYLRKECPTILENLVVVSPDVGGGERAQSLGNRLGISEIVIGYKIRGESGVEKIHYPTGVDFTNRKILMVDDIIDTGNTYVKASEEAKRLGAVEVYVYATHGLFTEGYHAVLHNSDKIFLSDTITQPFDSRYSFTQVAKSKITIIPFTDLFGEAIYRINRNIKRFGLLVF